MELLQIENHKLKISPYALTIAEFKAVWERDKSSTKDRAVQELSFVFLVSAYHSPYRAYDSKERILRVANDVVTLDKWIPDDLVKAAVAKYEELELTPTLALLTDVEEGIFKLRSFFKTVDVTKDEKGSKIASLIRSIGSISDVIKSMAILRQQVEKEMSVGVTGRAGRQIGARELPPDKRMKHGTKTEAS